MKGKKINNWDKFGEVNKKSIDSCFQYLSKALIFPISGEVSQETGSFKERTFKLVLHTICHTEDDFYGILAEGKSEHKAVVIALAEFSANESDTNYQLIEDYKDWFWNNR